MITPKERNKLNDCNNIIKQIFHKPVYINGYIVGNNPTIEIGNHMIEITDSNLLLKSMNDISESENILSWKYEWIYECIKDNKKLIKDLKYEGNKIYFTDNESFEYKIAKIISSDDVNMTHLDNIKSFLAKETIDIDISEDVIESLADNLTYTPIDIGDDILKITKQLLPTFKYTKKYISDVKLKVQHTDISSIKKALFIISNEGVKSYHMYAFLSRN